MFYYSKVFFKELDFTYLTLNYRGVVLNKQIMFVAFAVSEWKNMLQLYVPSRCWKVMVEHFIFFLQDSLLPLLEGCFPFNIIGDAGFVN